MHRHAGGAADQRRIKSSARQQRTAPHLLDRLSNNDDEVSLDVRRATCEWCGKVAPVLSQVSQEKNVVISYLDSTKYKTGKQIILRFCNLENYELQRINIHVIKEAYK